MFSRRPGWSRRSSSDVTIDFEGRQIVAKGGDTVAAAVLSANPGYTRATHCTCAPRAPYCMMGVCFECLMEIDGVPNRQACLMRVREGMKIRRQTLAPTYPKTRNSQS